MREGEEVGEEVGAGEGDDRAVRLPPAWPASARAGHAAAEEDGSREWGTGREGEEGEGGGEGGGGGGGGGGGRSCSTSTTGTTRDCPRSPRCC